MTTFSFILLTAVMAWSQIDRPYSVLPETFIHSASVPFGLEKTPALLTEIDDFEVYERPNGVQIDWKSLEEENNGGFQVLRSQDGSLWTPLTFIPGPNDSYRAYAEYGYFDEHPNQGENHYMIRKIYLDGSSAYSPSARVRYISNVASYAFTVYPNPASRSSEVFVKLEAADEPVTVDLYDMNGQRINQFFVSEYRTAISLGTLPSGAYVLSTEAGQVPYTKRLIVH